MRIITGIYKGRRLKSSNDLSIRPTTDRVKEYIFNILQDFPQDKNVVDLFSGSGSLGIEALSRGAKFVRFVEHAGSSIEILKSNLEHVQIPAHHYKIIKKDALDFANEIDIGADICFMDPPYIYPPVQELVDRVFDHNVIHRDGLLVLEHEQINPIEMESDKYQVFRHKKISRSLISFMQHR